MASIAYCWFNHFFDFARMRGFNIRCIWVIGFFVFFNPNKLSSQDLLSFEVQDSTKGWRRYGDFNLNFSSVGLSNWSGGGESSLSLATQSNYNIDFRNEKILFQNSLNVAYGVVRNGDIKAFRKTDDLFRVKTLYGRKISTDLYCSVSSEFWTQLADGFRYSEVDTVENTLISKFMSPSYLSLAIGFTHYKNDRYSFKVSPLTYKFTFVLNDLLTDPEAYGVDEGENVRAEGGASITGRISHEFSDAISIDAYANFFANYENLTEVDVNANTTLKFKINKFIASSFSASLVYDKDIEVQRDDGTTGTAVQLRSAISIGFAIKL